MGRFTVYRAEQLNRAQKTILAIGSLMIVVLLLFPPYQQAAERETAYRKYLGRFFFLNPPQPVPVDCYFVGCQTAPGSYFHVLLAKELFIEPCVTVTVVALLAIVILHFRPRAVHSIADSRTVRLAFSALLLLALPVPSGPQIVLFGTAVASMPWMIMAGGENIVVAMVFLVTFALCGGLLYAVITLGVLLRARRRQAI